MASMHRRGCLGRCLAVTQKKSNLWGLPARDFWTQRSQQGVFSPELYHKPLAGKLGE